MKKAISILSLILIAAICKAQLIVTGGAAVTPAQMINHILGWGVMATNITYTGSSQAHGIFNGGNLFIAGGGIILSTGIVDYNIGWAATNLLTTNLAQSGDTIFSPANTYDATVLEFDFDAASDSIRLNFIFASEEYNEFVNAPANDLFGIFISGPGYNNTQNIALIPGTSTPVSINNVNNGVSSGSATGPCMNCQYFIDNYGLNNFAFDGYTIPLTATAVVNPCETYHLKIVIADANNPDFDSALLIEDGSFSSAGGIDLFVDNVPALANDTVSACPGDTIILLVNQASNYNWSTGASTQSIMVVAPPLGFPIYQYSAFVTNPPFYSCFAYTPAIWIKSDTCSATAINPIENKSEVSFFPNPFNDRAKLIFKNSNHEHISLKIFDVAHKLIKVFETTGEEFEIQKGNIEPGIYFYELTNSTSQIIYDGKMVVQ
ncbi:MAG: choice-of-anchor L domain-containing protein [Bacteroidia bacterium]